MSDYPDWFYFPSHAEPPGWVTDFVRVIESCRASIESRSIDSLNSDQVLAILRPGLTELGYEVEAGKHKAEKIRRPVLFGERGTERVAYEVDAVHDALGVLVEVEAGRGARGNAVYRAMDARWMRSGRRPVWGHGHWPGLSRVRAVDISSQANSPAAW